MTIELDVEAMDGEREAKIEKIIKSLKDDENELCRTTASLIDAKTPVDDGVIGYLRNTYKSPLDKILNLINEYDSDSVYMALKRYREVAF